MRGALAFCLSGFLALSACSSPEPAPAPSESAAAQGAPSHLENGRAIIVPAGLDVVPVISSAAGAPWDADPFTDKTDWTGGTINLYRRNVGFRDGWISIDRTDRGSIYMVQVRSGTLGKCGQSEPLERALNALLVAFERQPLSADQLAALRKPWADRSSDTEVVSEGLIIRAVGACVQGLVLKAA